VVEAVFDHPNLVSDSGLLLMATLARRLGLPGLVRYWVHPKAPNSAVKVMTLVMGMIAGATNIDAMDRLRSGSTSRVLGFRPLAPSTLGTFLRTFTFGHVERLVASVSRTSVEVPTQRTRMPSAGVWAMARTTTPRREPPPGRLERSVTTSCPGWRRASAAFLP
jgi:hypothetical protein